MDTLPQNKADAFSSGALMRAEGYGKQFNPFRNRNNPELFNEWLKGWITQNIVMNE